MPGSLQPGADAAPDVDPFTPGEQSTDAYLDRLIANLTDRAAELDRARDDRVRGERLRVETLLSVLADIREEADFVGYLVAQQVTAPETRVLSIAAAARALRVNVRTLRRRLPHASSSRQAAEPPPF